MQTDLVCAWLGNVDDARCQLAAQIFYEAHGKVLGLVSDVHMGHATWHGQQQGVVLLILCWKSKSVRSKYAKKQAKWRRRR